MLSCKWRRSTGTITFISLVRVTLKRVLIYIPTLVFVCTVDDNNYDYYCIDDKFVATVSAAEINICGGDVRSDICCVCSRVGRYGISL